MKLKKPLTTGDRWVVIGFSCLVVALGVVVGLWRSRSVVAPDTADQDQWPRYTNDAYHYSLAYPEYFDLSEDTKKLAQLTPQQGDSYLAQSETFGLTGYNPDNVRQYLSLYVFAAPQSVRGCPSLADCLAAYNTTLTMTDGWQIGDQEKTTVDGQPAVLERVDRPADGWTHFYTFLFTNNNFLVLRFTTNTDWWQYGQQLNREILSTMTLDSSL
ncbi:hypothetical protein HY933_04415 [Candidatus Falkowbacteria bacterium]|nr:hypothetical protein [Candidatus Falkowbacteria bacterium]